MALKEKKNVVEGHKKEENISLGRGEYMGEVSCLRQRKCIIRLNVALELLQKKISLY